MNDYPELTPDESEQLDELSGKLISDGMDRSEADVKALATILQRRKEKTQPPKRKTAWTLSELLKTEFPPVIYMISGIVSFGLTILAGAPKLGKSWMLLLWAIGVSIGGIIMGKIGAVKSSVMYLALEDTGRRLQDRLRKLGAVPADNLYFFTEWTTGNAGLRSFLKEHPDVKMCIIDTWGRYAKITDQNDYSEITSRAAEIKAIADELEIAIVVCHHTRKKTNEDGDWVEGVLGSQGLSGAADTTIVLRRGRGNRQAELLITGRDVPESELVLNFNLDCGGWTIEGSKQEIQETAARQEILDWLKENGPHTPKDVSAGMKADGGHRREYSTVKNLLWKMSNDGTLQNNNGVYAVYGVHGFTDVKSQNNPQNTVNPVDCVNPNRAEHGVSPEVSVIRHDDNVLEFRPSGMEEE